MANGTVYKRIYVISDSSFCAEMLCSHLNTCNGIIVSGICYDINHLKKILFLLKIDIIILISSNCNFIIDCKSKIVDKPLLLIGPNHKNKRNVYNNICLDETVNFQFISLDNKLTNLMFKLAALSNSKIDRDILKDYSFISKREREILLLICNGKKNKEIAHELFLSIKTIENHRNNILKKTKYKSMMSLINELFRIGFFYNDFK